MVKPIKGAPQLSRLLRDLSVDRFSALAATPAFKAAEGALDEPPKPPEAKLAFRTSLAALHGDDLKALEIEALRITRLNNPQADNLHLRIADGVDFNCRSDLEDEPGPLARAARSYASNQVLFRHVERAMQLRSYRDHRTVYEAHDLQGPVPLAAEDINQKALELSIKETLDLRDGCTIESTELPDTEHSTREIMLAVTTAGALANQRTFDAEKGVGAIQYRPAQELIIVYKPDIGRIEVCGRDWSDRKSAVMVFASKVLGEELSERPLRQRNYDLRPFARNLDPEIPATLSDRIIELRVTEARFALGSYDRKVTIRNEPGQPIDQIATRVLRGLGTSFGKPFLCDVELYLRRSKPDGGESKMRFNITNQNRSGLQSNTDPQDRAIGFELLSAMGVVSTVEQPTRRDVSDLFDSLLDLLGHGQDRISEPELRSLNANVSRLTNLGFLQQRTIASAVLVEDEDVGTYEAVVRTDLDRGTASLGHGPDDMQRVQDVNELLSWTINRGHVRETVLQHLSSLGTAKRGVDLDHGLVALGNAQVAGDQRPVYLWESCENLETLEKVVRSLQRETQKSLVLATGTALVGFLGRHVVVNLRSALAAGDRELLIERLDQLWLEAQAHAGTDDSVSLEGDAEIGVLRVPGEDAWTIVGAARVTAVRKLVAAHRRGEIGVKTGALLEHTGSKSPQACFGKDWDDLVKNRYIYQPKNTFWALKINST
ncbi:hypothetical protein [Vannielia litorea]|uniref:hypothetical protein n=1 Tax=Vannielia litorea TaxID=1217970 RepID=UPI001BCC8820|nr:hypothetical protein [Vannielia litorea]MBS8228336.1 hypothetical protein [Vannielia litorea]